MKWARAFPLFIVLELGCSPPKTVADARSVHDAVLVLDSHVDVLLPDTPKRYYAPDGGSRTSLEQLTAGGVDAAVFAIAVGPGPETPDGDVAAKREADAKLAAILQLVATSGGRLVLARTADDVERAHRDGHVAVLLGFQNARILGTDLGAFDRFFAAGVRVAALNHMGHNAFSDSYVVHRLGVEHAGVGTDFNHGAGIDGFDGERDAGNVTAELVRRGYTKDQIAAIWGGNFLRVLRAARAGARSDASAGAPAKELGTEAFAVAP